MKRHEENDENDKIEKKILTDFALKDHEKEVKMLLEPNEMKITPILGKELGLMLAEALTVGSETGTFSEDDFYATCKWAHESLIDLRMLLMITKKQAAIRFRNGEVEMKFRM
jgi:hypothetical protein